MIECGNLMTLQNWQLEARFCNMKPCPIRTSSLVASQTSMKAVLREPVEHNSLVESKWKTDVYFSLSPYGSRITSLDKAITIGQVVYVHVVGLTDEKLTRDHRVSLKHCGITDKNGRNEITLIQENVPDSTRTHVRLVEAPGTIGPNENKAAVFAFQGHFLQSLPKS